VGWVGKGLREKGGWGVEGKEGVGGRGEEGVWDQKMRLAVRHKRAS